MEYNESGVRKARVVLYRETCTICSEQIGLVVDHDHSTGLIRGLLCTNCNTGLGMFKDNIKILEAAIKYLKDPPGLKADFSERIDPILDWIPPSRASNPREGSEPQRVYGRPWDPNNGPKSLLK